MKDVIVGARVPKRLKEKMDQAVEKGLFINISDLVRNAIREKMRGEIT